MTNTQMDSPTAPIEESSESPRSKWCSRAYTAFGIFLGSFVFVYFGSKQGIDLEVYLEGGRAVVNGNELYTQAFGANLDTPLPFTYPPGAAVLAAILNIVPGQLTFVLWAVASILLLTALVRATFGSFPGLNAEQKTLRNHFYWFATGLAIGASAPVSSAVYLGQISIILVVLVYFSSVRAMERNGGFLTGVMTGIKITPGLFVVFYALERKWRAVMLAGVGFVAVLAVGLVFAPQETFSYFSKVLWTAERVGAIDHHMNGSVLGITARLSLPNEVGILLAALAGVGALFLAHLTYKRGLVSLAICVVGLGTCLASPISWIHHFVWVIPTFGLLYPKLKSNWQRGLSLIAVSLIALHFEGISLVIPATSIGSTLLPAATVIATIILLTLIYLVQKTVVIQHDHGLTRANQLR